MIDIRKHKKGDWVEWNVKNIRAKIIKKETEANVVLVRLAGRSDPKYIHCSYLDEIEDNE